MLIAEQDELPVFHDNNSDAQSSETASKVGVIQVRSPDDTIHRSVTSPGHSDVLFKNCQEERSITGISGLSHPVSLGNTLLGASGDKSTDSFPANGVSLSPPCFSGRPGPVLPTGPAAETGESQIWIGNDSFIPSSEWLEIASKSYQQKTACITANVPYTITGVKSSNIGKIYGSNNLPTNADCGKIYRKVFCNADKSHKPANMHIRCNDPGCPVCYKKPVNKIATRVSERVAGYKTVYPEKRVYSLIFWPKFGTVYKDLDEAHADGKRMLADMDADGAAVFIHTHRIRKELKPKFERLRRKARLLERPTKGDWEYAHEDALGLGALENYTIPGVHFHAPTSGYLEDSTAYNARTGAGYKKKGYLENQDAIQKNVYYLATHAVYQPGKDTVRYYGLMSKNKLRRTQTGESFENLHCEICDSTLADYDYNADTGELSKFPNHPVLTRKFKIYRYWAVGCRDFNPPGGKFLSESANKKKLREILDEARAAQNANLKGWDLL